MKDCEPFSKAGLFRDYIAFYEATWLEGKLLICNEATLKEKAKQCLGLESWLCEGFKVINFYSIAEGCLKTRAEPADKGLKKLMKAFEVLELICVNLFLSPWRKEIRTLKTFTGNFVYFVQSVFPEDTLKNVLKKIGYTPTKATEFSVVENINEQKTREIAFEIFLARNECEVILERVNEEENCSFLTILHQRSQKYCQDEVNEHKQEQPPEEPLGIGRERDQPAHSCSSPQQKSLNKTELPLEIGQNNNKEEHLSELLHTRDMLPLVSINQTIKRHQEIKHEATGTCHFHGKCSDSEEFLNIYSDIAIAKKPFIQKDHSCKKIRKQHKYKTGKQSGASAMTMNKLTIAETNSATLHSQGPSGPQSFAICTKATSEESKYISKQVTQETHDNSQFSNATTETDTSHDPLNSVSHKVEKQKENAPYNTSITDMDHEDCELSSSFSKLKISEANEDSLKFPVEETTQPEHELYTENHHVTDPHLTNKECLHSANIMAPNGKPMVDECRDSDGKKLLMETSTESFINIKQPPHSLYIPPASLEGQSHANLMDCHWTSSASKGNTQLQSSLSPSKTATFPTDNSLYTMEETQEKFVIISKQTHQKD